MAADPSASPGGTLYVVATPIGNLSDVTLRALEVLRSVPLVAAEDTRVTRRLLGRHGIATPLVSYHARSGERRLEEVIRHLRGGADLALVTDAGTPGVSDPGEDLVARWAAEGGRVVPVPGASAVLAAVAAAGIAGPRWSFEGFLPRSGRERRERIARIAGDDRGTVLFERPDRLAATLADLAEAAGGDRPAVIGRELTKAHEEIVRGSLGGLARRTRAGDIVARGEAVVVVGSWPIPGYERSGDRPSLDAARAEVDRLVAAGEPRGGAAARVAAQTGHRRRDLYRRSEAS
ncbi:MAG TPA: 16S rRNA (cytidine(1402)-2'-O)-methyltransferase [Candidatus Limnocylindrales bacterium]|nr:16S rRNA (cytidine(1402)-2'-O)-methyltransferase [Candidatus Limnocylindrales bacterium]